MSVPTTSALILLIRILWNLVTLFSTIMSSSSSIMVQAFSSYGPLFMKIHRFKRCPLSNSNIFYQNFMTLGHIVEYHNVFFKFNNGPYHTRLSVVMALCLWKFTILNDVCSLTQIFFIRILWNLVTLFSTIMSSSSSIMVQAFSSYGPLFMKIHRFKRCPLSNSNIFYQNFMTLGHIVEYHNVFFKFDNGPYHTRLSVVMALYL